jgi:hypothetical protein
MWPNLLEDLLQTWSIKSTNLPHSNNPLLNTAKYKLNIILHLEKKRQQRTWQKNIQTRSGKWTHPVIFEWTCLIQRGFVYAA